MHTRTNLRLLALMALLALTLAVPTFSLARPAAAPAPGAVRGDLGDAPDQTNNWGMPMTAYAAVPANFPSVFNGAAPVGPLHRMPAANGWLGVNPPSVEYDADVLNDADGITNIDPPTNAANRDRFDNGVFQPAGPMMNIALPQCANTGFNYVLTGVAAPPVPNVYVNVWFDFNHDGDWADVLNCVNAAGVVVIVQEWAVRNQMVVLPAGASALFATPAFPSFQPVVNNDIWMRITVAGSTAPIDPATGQADGRGPPNTYAYGETEDYYLRRIPGGLTYEPYPPGGD